MNKGKPKLRQTLPLINLYLASYSDLVGLKVLLTHTHTVGGPGVLLGGLFVELQCVYEGKFSWELQRCWPVLTNTACLPHRLITE